MSARIEDEIERAAFLSQHLEDLVYNKADDEDVRDWATFGLGARGDTDSADSGPSNSVRMNEKKFTWVSRNLSFSVFLLLPRSVQMFSTADAAFCQFA